MCGGAQIQTSARSDWKGRSGSVTGKLSRLEFFEFLYVEPCENLDISLLIQSLSQIKKIIKEVIAALSNETLEKVWKFISFRISRITNMDGGRFEQHYI